MSNRRPPTKSTRVYLNRDYFDATIDNLGITQAQVAKEANMFPEQISRAVHNFELNRARGTMQRATAMRLATALAKHTNQTPEETFQKLFIPLIPEK